MLQQIEISEKEFKTAYFSLKRNRSSAYDDINANVARSVYNETQRLLFYIFQCSLDESAFPEKQSKLHLSLKTGEPADLTHYRPRTFQKSSRKTNV